MATRAFAVAVQSATPTADETILALTSAASEGAEVKDDDVVTVVTGERGKFLADILHQVFLYQSTHTVPFVSCHHHILSGKGISLSSGFIIWCFIP